MTGDETFPTVFIESILIMVTIIVHEGRNVIVCDILGDFLSKDMDKDVKVELHGNLMEMVVKIESQIYQQHVIYKRVSPVLYISLNSHYIYA